MFVFRIFLVVCVGLFLVSSQTTEVLNGDIVFTVEHRLNGKEFSPRTKIHLVKKPDGKQALIYPEKNGVFNDDVMDFKAMLDSNSLYTIRIQAHHNNTTSVPVVSSLPACELQKSGFKEDITVYLDPKQNIVGVSYSTPTSTVSRECDSKKIKDGAVFQTRLKLGEGVPIQWIPLKAVGARPANMKDVKLSPGDATAPPERKTFLQQYWYIVLIMVIYMFLGRVEPEKAAPAAGTAAAAPQATAAQQ